MEFMPSLRSLATHHLTHKTLAIAAGMGLSDTLARGDVTSTEAAMAAGLIAASGYVATPVAAGLVTRWLCLSRTIPESVASKNWRAAFNFKNLNPAFIRPLSAVLDATTMGSDRLYTRAYKAAYYGLFAFYQAPHLADLVVLGSTHDLLKAFVLNMGAPLFIGGLALLGGDMAGVDENRRS